ncbi:MAG: hypothetical protein ACJ71Z_03975 [Aeromicrobium sp.]
MAGSGESEFRTITQLRRDALEQDLLLFCLAFSGGALFYAVVRAVTEGASGGDFWSIGLSKGLLLSGLVTGEAFIFWNLGIRQGIRGHSIGKHRVGLKVADIATREPAGLLRGAIRGLLLAFLVDVAAVAVPIGIPTVLRVTTPDSWHIGLTTYIAAAVLLIPVLIPTRRDLADRLLHTEIIRASGKDAVTSLQRRRALLVLDTLGVLGVAAVMATYLAFYAPFILRFPPLN